MLNQTSKQTSKPRPANLRQTVLSWLILLPLVLLILAPMWHFLVYSFMPARTQFVWPYQWLPLQPTLDNFLRLFQDDSLPAARWFVNTVTVTFVGTVLVVLISSLSGYAFARLVFPGRDFLFYALLIGLTVPAAVTLIPAFLLLRDVKLLDTHLALWLPALANAGGMFLLRQHFFSVPRDLEDAARVDGAGRFRLYWQVCLPLVQS